MADYSGYIDCAGSDDSDDEVDMLHFNQNIDTYQNLIRLSETRQRVISHNLANVNTPGFKALDLDLRLQEGVSHGHSAGQPAEARIIERTGLPARADGNNVDIDVEVAESNKNALLHQTYLQLLSGQISNLRRAMQT
jgi:flagellar basal-body rod protein FlgB